MWTWSSITWQGALQGILSSMEEPARPGSIGAPALAISLYVLTNSCHRACTARDPPLAASSWGAEQHDCPCCGPNKLIYALTQIRQAHNHKLSWAQPAPEMWRLSCRQAYGDLYHATDFHHRQGAGYAEHGNCQIQDQDFQGCYDCVQQCDLGGLADLETSQSSVQVMHNHLSLGVLKA